jgi:hypothetical protein
MDSGGLDVQILSPPLAPPFDKGQSRAAGSFCPLETKKEQSKCTHISSGPPATSQLQFLPSAIGSIVAG